MFLSFSLLYAADVLNYFSASSDGKSITLNWKSSDEFGISQYEIERSASGQIFKSIATVQAKGFAYNYSFRDESVFLRDKDGNVPTIAQSSYKYRIKIVNKDNSSLYSNTAYVAHNVSGIRRTWGMIKEMFR